MGGGAAAERGQDGPELRLAAAQGAGRRRRCGDPHARARLRAADRSASSWTSCRLERLVAEAGRAAAAGEPRGAAREALALFRGEPLADLADEPFAAAEIRRLEELRERPPSWRSTPTSPPGRHQEVVGEIDALLAENPLRERLHAQRMLALYRCGRQAEALEAYREARRMLVEEIGVEPGAGAAAPARRDPAPGSLAGRRAGRGRAAARARCGGAPPLVGRDGELRGCARCWQRAAAGAGALVTLARRLRDGQDAAGGGARRRGPSRAARR